MDGKGRLSRVYDDRWLVEIGESPHGGEVITVADFEPSADHVPDGSTSDVSEIEWNVNADTAVPVVFRLVVHRHNEAGDHTDCTAYHMEDLKERDVTYPSELTELVDFHIDAPVALPSNGALTSGESDE